MGLLTDTQKAALGGVFAQIHDTFKKPIYALKEGPIVALSHNPGYSSIYGSTGIKTQKPAPLIKQAFYARIQYGEKQGYGSLNGGGSEIKLAEGEIRLKVDLDGYEFVKDAKRVEIDGKLYEFVTSGRPHGLFSNDFYTFYLKEVQ